MLGRHTIVSAAKQLPKRHPAVEKLLLGWIEETSVPEKNNAPSIEYVRVAMSHTEMKYRLGFLSKEEALAELKEEGKGLVSDPGHTSLDKTRLEELLSSIENDSFEFAYKNP